MIAVASVTVMGSFMSILDTTMVNIAVPTLVRSFQTSLSNVQWVTTGYILALAVVVPLTRWAADRFGTKRVWLDLGRALHLGLAPLRPLLVAPDPDRLPGHPRAWRRDDPADRPDDPRERGRPCIASGG